MDRVREARVEELPGPYAYREGAWRVVEEAGGPSEPWSSLRIVTFNVLFDSWRGSPYKPRVTASAERFRRQRELFEAGGQDVLALNEVTGAYLSSLLSSPWVRGGYASALPPDDPELAGSFGNLILSRRPILKLWRLRLPALGRPVLCALIGGGARPLAVAASHLSALASRTRLRARQLAALAGALDDLGAEAGFEDRLILGDLNFHAEAESASIPPGYIDVWTALRGAEPGATFDAERNPLLQELWPLGFEHRRMRLDRALLSSSRLTPRSIELCFDEPIYAAARPPRVFRGPRQALRAPLNLLRRVACAIADRRGWRGPRRLEHYLMCSDHFGLALELAPVGRASKSS